MRLTRLLIVVLMAGAAFTVPQAAPAAAASYKPCKPVVNPYPGTRYEGVNLSRIRTLKASCRTARHVARKAHYKALAIPVAAGPIRRFTWHGWRVRGDLRPAEDRYIARKGTRRVRWRF
jgi:hypothetical protein